MSERSTNQTDTFESDTGRCDIEGCDRDALKYRVVMGEEESPSDLYLCRPCHRAFEMGMRCERSGTNRDEVQD